MGSGNIGSWRRPCCLSWQRWTIRFPSFRTLWQFLNSWRNAGFVCAFHVYNSSVWGDWWHLYVLQSLWHIVLWSPHSINKDNLSVAWGKRTYGRPISFQANTMVEYPVDEAMALLKDQLKVAMESIGDIVSLDCMFKFTCVRRRI